LFEQFLAELLGYQIPKEVYPVHMQMKIMTSFEALPGKYMQENAIDKL